MNVSDERLRVAITEMERDLRTSCDAANRASHSERFGQAKDLTRRGAVLRDVLDALRAVLAVRALIPRWRETADSHHRQEIGDYPLTVRAGAAGMRAVRDNCANELAAIVGADAGDGR